MKAKDVQAALTKIASPERVAASMRFFKTGKGEYGEGDQFIGVSVPDQRKIARAFATLPLVETRKLLASKIHEERLVALFILVRQFEKGDVAEQHAIVDLYLASTARINNWDLVDSSAYQILGRWLLTRDTKLLCKLAKSKSLWERRIAMIATYAFTKRGQPAETFAIAELLLDDEHDLIHKAVGWMLREVGEKVDVDQLREFLDAHVAKMPRTALRYAIEKLPPAERKAWLAR
jgi:3-methyladenine DNA glycosylase AlkD